MGLDMWLKAKTKKNLNTEDTGVCSGIFNISLKGEDLQEIGYWRNAYEQRDLIVDNFSGQEKISGNNYLTFSKEDIDNIIKEATRILTTHKFDEEGYDITPEEMLDYNDFSFFPVYVGGTFNSEVKWKDTIEFFKMAKKILEEDKEAKIYYIDWY